MVKWTLFTLSWVCCVVFCIAIFSQAEELAVLFRALGVPGTVVDIFLANRGVQLVTALSLVLMIGYGLPMIISGIIAMSRLSKTRNAIVAACHEQRSLYAIEDLLLMDERLQASLSPVTRWASEQTTINGDIRVAARLKPSDLVSADQLAKDNSFLATYYFLPKLLVAVTLAISLLILAHSADRAFAEILSVRGTDYGTMLLGLRSATTAMAIAIVAALIIWALQIFIDTAKQERAQDIVKNLDRLIIFDDSEAVQLTTPLAPSSDASLEQFFIQVASKIEEKSLGISTRIMRDNDEKHLSLLAAVQQAMSELQSLRQDVDNIGREATHELPMTSHHPQVDKITSAIRALKDSTTSELPQL
jgi:hypothetical protein